MNVSCPECRSVFRIDPAKVPVSGVDARCSVCGAVIAVSVAAGNARQDVTATAGHTVETSETTYPPRSTSAGIVAEVPSSPPEDVRGASQSPGSKPFAPDVAAPTLREPEADAPVAPVAQSSEPSAAAETRTRPVNPYLNNTPELRARRLARALVSDLVAYNPQKREEGLRDGTLRQLFREEIRKSWDEYVEQVGASVAESTPHFQDALNDVLAGGRRVF